MSAPTAPAGSLGLQQVVASAPEDVERLKDERRRLVARVHEINGQIARLETVQLLGVSA